MSVPVLHCYADHKWTGPSEPVLRLCCELSRRGWRSDLACVPAPRGHQNQLAERARAAGIQTFEPFGHVYGMGLMGALSDCRRFAELVARGGYRIIHCHGSRDHLIAGWSRPQFDSRDVRIIRTHFKAHDFSSSLLMRRYFGPTMIDHLVVLSDRFAVQAVSRLRLAPERVTTIRGAVDTEEFRPQRPPDGFRGQFGLSPEDVVVGVVARIQRHRRFEVLLKAARIVRNQDPRVKVAICGRGTHKRAILDRPVAKMRLQGTVVFLGYRQDDYRETLSMFDAGLMLVPGTDGSCRAALQMAAMGKPLIVTRRGVLPDIVRDGETGIVVVKDTPESVAEAIVEMAADPDSRAQWGQAAREHMCRYFSLPRQADEVISVYERLLVDEAPPAE